MCLLEASLVTPRADERNNGRLRWGCRTTPIKVKTITAATGLTGIADAFGSAILGWSALCTDSRGISTIWHPERVMKTTESHELEDALQETSRHALTTVLAILDTGVNSFSIIAEQNAVLDRHVFRVAVPSRCERGLCRIVPNAIKRQTVGPIIEAQWWEPTCSIQVRTTLEEAHHVVE